MCCTQREMGIEGRRLGWDDGWFQPEYVPCCIRPARQDAQKEQRKGGLDTGIQCGRCKKDTMRLLRVVRRAEEHRGEALPVPVCELACPCGSVAALAAPVVERLAAKRGVTLHLPEPATDPEGDPDVW